MLHMLDNDLLMMLILKRIYQDMNIGKAMVMNVGNVVG